MIAMKTPTDKKAWALNRLTSGLSSGSDGSCLDTAGVPFATGLKDFAVDRLVASVLLYNLEKWATTYRNHRESDRFFISFFIKQKEMLASRQLRFGGPTGGK